MNAQLADRIRYPKYCSSEKAHAAFVIEVRRKMRSTIRNQHEYFKAIKVYAVTK